MILTGKFTFPSVGEARGKLALDGTRSSLQVWSEDNDLTPIWYEEMHRDVGSIKGTLDDQNKVSLINCLTQGKEFPTTRGEIVVHKASFFPHYVVFGDQHISHEEETVTEVRFVIEDGNVLFHDPDAFGGITDLCESSVNVRSLVEQFVQSDADRKIPIGKHHAILYYTGNASIFEMDTSSEKISARREIVNSEAYDTPDGVRIDNEIPVMLKFHFPVTFNKAVHRASRVFQFLELLIGRSQNLKEFAIFKEPEQKLRVCGNGFPKYDRHENESRPNFCDVLIKPAQEPEKFSGVLKNWLERDDKCRAARNWFFSYFAKQRLYDPPRIIRAADMFNYLRDVPRSKSSLEQKINHCAKCIAEKIGDDMKGLKIAIEQAVVCRNYYVHAEYHKKDQVRIDYDGEPEFRVFLTDTLEFVFAMSDLIKAGWDVKAWRKTDSSSPHPLSRYFRHYKENLKKLNRRLSEKGNYT